MWIFSTKYSNPFPSFLSLSLSSPLNSVPTSTLFRTIWYLSSDGSSSLSNQNQAWPFASSLVPSATKSATKSGWPLPAGFAIAMGIADIATTEIVKIAAIESPRSVWLRFIRKNFVFFYKMDLSHLSNVPVTLKFVPI